MSIKTGMTVETVRACGALGADGAVDLAAGSRGCLLALDGDTAQVELQGSKSVVYVSSEYLKGCRGRPRRIPGA
jgi:hypothetical protein